MTGRFVEKDGRLCRGDRRRGRADSRTSGRALVATKRGDTESLGLADGIAVIGIEEANEIASFDFGQDGVFARARTVALPPQAKRLPLNRGFEALGIAPSGSPAAGAIIAISERSSEAGPTTEGFIIGGRTPGLFELRRTDNYDVTDLAFLPDGDMVILERRYSLLRGIAMRIRRIAGHDIRPGAVLDGPVLIEAGPRMQIDNMQALAVNLDKAGATARGGATLTGKEYYFRERARRRTRPYERAFSNPS